MSRKQGVRQKRKLLALAVSTGVRMAMKNHTYAVGDQFYRQTSGGAIGLLLTGAYSRVFMARWERIYLEKVKRAVLKMWIYDRYMDDSNQIAETIPPLTKYNIQSEKMEIDERRWQTLSSQVL